MLSSRSKDPSSTHKTTTNPATHLQAPATTRSKTAARRAKSAAPKGATKPLPAEPKPFDWFVALLYALLIVGLLVIVGFCYIVFFGPTP